MFVIIAVVALICWIAHSSYKAGVRDADLKHAEQAVAAKTPDWCTYVGKISGLREHHPIPGAYSLEVAGEAVAYSSIALKRALADSFDDGIGRGREIVYTTSSEKALEGFTSIEEWTGPMIPSEGIHEKHASYLQPKHRNQFLANDLRRQIEGTPEYENVRFY